MQKLVFICILFLNFGSNYPLFWLKRPTLENNIGNVEQRVLYPSPAISGLTLAAIMANLYVIKSSNTIGLKLIALAGIACLTVAWLKNLKQITLILPIKSQEKEESTYEN